MPGAIMEGAEGIRSAGAEFLVFEVRYTRERGANTWRAVTHERPMIRGWETDGTSELAAVEWPGRTEGEEEIAAIHVSIEWGPRLFDLSSQFDEAWIAMRQEANNLADRCFRKRRPDAEIEHGDASGSRKKPGRETYAAAVTC